MRRFLWVLAVLAGCKDNSAAASDPPRATASPHVVGVFPDQWRCDSVAPLDALGPLLGGTARQIDSPASVPRGVPHPCSYEVQIAGTGPAELEYWTFDLDCRDGMKQRADALFAQYRETSREAVAHFAQIDAGVAHPSTTPPVVPQTAVDVDVGAKGLDHHGEGLIFIDDDAPCYVRVTGKDAAHRLALARLVARNLTLDNAPMVPRARP